MGVHLQKTFFNLKNISKTFGKTEDTKVEALKNISLSIKEGEFSAIVGPSGSGKSTLLNIMSGFDSPSLGEVLLDEKPFHKFKSNELADFRRDHIGFIFQSYNLIPVLTVEENIEYVLILQKIKAKVRSEKVGKILEAVGLKGFEKRFPPSISGGQQQRVAIARAMVSEPNIIIADEPTANLDSNTGVSLIDMMLELNKNYNTTFVFSTHAHNIMNKARRLITLKDGRIESDKNH